jgi:hypothetical protein
MEVLYHNDIPVHLPWTILSCACDDCIDRIMGDRWNLFRHATDQQGDELVASFIKVARKVGFVDASAAKAYLDGLEERLRKDPNCLGPQTYMRNVVRTKKTKTV